MVGNIDNFNKPKNNIKWGHRQLLGGIKYRRKIDNS